MKPSSHGLKPCSAFTLVELMIGTAVAVIVGGGIYYLLSTGSILYAKNIALNVSGMDMRKSIDQTLNAIYAADDLPSLIDEDGNDLGVGGGPAAGIRFDQYLGGPYVVSTPGNGDELSANTRTFTIERHTNPLASPPIPTAGDVLMIDGASEGSRFLIQSVSSGTVPTDAVHTITVTLASTLGEAIDLEDTTVAYLVRPKAFIVADGQLRHYHSVENLSDYSSPAAYTVMNHSIVTDNGGGTPFNLALEDGMYLLQIDLRMLESTAPARLAVFESGYTNSYFRVQTSIRPRKSF